MASHRHEYEVTVATARTLADGRYGFVASVRDLRRRRDDGTVEHLAALFGEYHGEDAAEAEARAREGVERWIHAQAR